MLSAATVRMVKGAAASIILLLMTEPRGGNQEWLERYTGYTDKPVSQALSFLVENGMIIRTGDRGEFSYRLAGNSLQLPLPVDQLEEPEEPDEHLELPEPSTEPEPATSDEIESEIFRLDPLASSGINQSLDSGDIKPLARAAPESEIFRLNLETLDAVGIREPARSRLARLDFVTPRAIRYHCSKAPNLGLAIYRIEHQWRVHDDWIDPTSDEDLQEVPSPLPATDLQPVPVSLAAAYDNAMASLAGELSRQEYETWVRCMTLAGMDADQLVINTGNQFAAAWLDEHIKLRMIDLIGAPIRFEAT